METIIYNGETINYIIGKRGTKNLYARLIENNVVKISVPYLISKKSIEKFVGESYFKLLKKKNKKKRSIIENEEVKVLGNVYNINDVDNLDYLLITKIKEYLKENYLNIVKMMNIDIAPKIVLKRVKGYLGQYNKKKHQITLNILVGHLDKECLYYVLIHELAHIKYMNHKIEFWNYIERYLPIYRKLRIRCKKEFVYYENY